MICFDTKDRVWLRIEIVIVLLFYLVVSAALILFGFESNILLICGLATVFMTFLAFLYLCGINTQNDWIMIPFVVAEIIIRILFGFFVGAVWIVFLLALFDLMSVNSPVGE